MNTTCNALAFERASRCSLRRKSWWSSKSMVLKLQSISSVLHEEMMMNLMLAWLIV